MSAARFGPRGRPSRLTWALFGPLLALAGCQGSVCCDGAATSPARDVSVPASYPFTYRGTTKPVHLFESRTPDDCAGIVVVLHELTGLTPETLRFAGILAEAGFEVHVPLMFGRAGETDSLARTLVRALTHPEWEMVDRDASGPIVRWLRGLCRDVSRRRAGARLGVVGLCLSGALPIALLREPAVVAPVVSQPALPLFAVSGAAKRSLGVSASDLHVARRRVRDEGLRILAFRFELDDLSPPERFSALRSAFGSAFDGHTIPHARYVGDGYRLKEGAHSVLTGEYCERWNHPSHEAVRLVIEFLRRRLRPPA